jgi:hypothetical protein
MSKIFPEHTKTIPVDEKKEGTLIKKSAYGKTEKSLFNSFSTKCSKRNLIP